MDNRLKKMSWVVCGALLAGHVSCGEAGVSGGVDPASGGLWQERDGKTVYEEAFPTHPDGNVFERAGDGVVIANWAEVLPQEDLNQIAEVGEDRVVFGAGASQGVRGLEPMQIISSIDKNNYFLRRVLRVEEVGGQVIVHTQDAAINEVLIHGTLSMGALTDAPTQAPHTSMAAAQQVVNRQGLNANGRLGKRQFSAELTQNSFQVAAELPINDTVAILPELRVELDRGLDGDFGFDADIEMSGSQEMCDALQQSNDDDWRFNVSLDGFTDTYPAELNQLLWAMEWGGNRRGGNAQVRATPNGRTWPAHDTFHGTRRSYSGRNRSARDTPISYIQMRPEFVTALTEFEAYVNDTELQEHFELGGQYVRVPNTPASHREEVLARYRELEQTLEPRPREIMHGLIDVLEAQPNDDLQWISTSLAVARHHCRGVTRDTRSAVSTRTTVRAQGSLEIKAAHSFEGPLPDSPLFVKNETTGAFRHNIHLWDAVWTVWAGWFPIIIVPTADIAVIVTPPEVRGSYKAVYGPYELVLEGGYDRSGDDAMDVAVSGEAPQSCEGGGACLGYRPNFSTGRMVITASEANFAMSGGYSIGPEVMFKLYGVAGLGAALPVYMDAEITAQGRGEANNVQGSIATASACASIKSGLRLDVIGRLDDPLAVFTQSGRDKTPLAEIRHTFYDTCAGENAMEPRCFQGSVGYRAGITGNGFTFSEPVWFPSMTGCPKGALTFTLEWHDKQDLDLYVKEPSGEVISYGGNTVSEDGGAYSSAGSCAGPGRGQCPDQAEPYTEKVAYGEAIGAIVPGDYTFWAKNFTGDSTASGTIKVTYTDSLGVTRIMREFPISLAAERNASSQEFSITVDQ